MHLEDYGFGEECYLYEESMEGLKDTLAKFLDNRQNKIFDKNGFQNTMKGIKTENDVLRGKIRDILNKYKTSETSVPKECAVIANLMKKEATAVFTNNIELVDKYVLPLGIFEMISRYKNKLDTLTQERIDRTDVSSDALNAFRDANRKYMNLLIDSFNSSNKLSFANLIWIDNIINHTIAKFHTLNKIIGDTEIFIKITQNPNEVEKIKKHPYIANKYDMLVKVSKEVRLCIMKYVKSVIAINKCLLRMLKIFETTEKISGVVTRFKKKAYQNPAYESLEDEILNMLDMCIGTETQSIEAYGFILN